MPLSSIIRQECPICGKVAVEVSRGGFGSSVTINLQCGHTIWTSTLDEQQPSIYDELVFADGSKPREYQIEAIKFIEEAGGRAILADEQGLGKTIEILSLIRLHYNTMLPAVITVPTSARRQWMQEIMRVLCPNNTKEEIERYMPQVITSGKDIAIPGFKIYVVTFDMLKKHEMWELVKDEIKTIIIDECQRIKNHLSGRAKAVQRIAKGKNVEHIVPMSGTPIKNNAGEYFTILNLVKPTKFNNYTKYLDEYCDYFHNGFAYKVGGLANPEKFHEDTKDFIIRRTKKQVLKDLPDKERKFFHVDLDPKLNKAYAQGLKELEDLYYGDEETYGSPQQRGAAQIAIMSKLRHLTGYSKTEECFEWVTEFLESTDRKLVIFTHHIDVMDILNVKLKAYCEEQNIPKPLMIRSELSGDERQRVIERFRDDGHRVMLASTLAAGEAINLQFCSDAVMLERQWNPAGEEQAEDRFHRFGQKNNVSITYMIASGTIDEYFTELVESKRSIVSSTVDNVKIEWNEASLMSELTAILVSRGRERWTL